ncbi:hypothetical protein [Trichormus sp. NMC-1]|uniref:hypothetical protein n=1 Tax=Trichormus sp. NMC-1 TaxID=1853259 RepID=UPI0008DBEA6C|nr:hypothetical protein [Trichormus sp. NMC-1]
MFILLLGGNAIFGLFILARKLSPSRLELLFQADILSWILKQTLLNVLLGLLSWLIYRYLRYLAGRRYFLRLGKY